MTAQQNQNQKQDQKLGSDILQVDVVCFEAGSVCEIPCEVYWSILGECGGWIPYSKGEIFCVSDGVLGVWFGRVVDRFFRVDGLFVFDVYKAIAEFRKFSDQ